MSVSSEVCDQASTWINELEDDQKVELLLELPGYAWEEVESVYGDGYAGTAVVRLKSIGDGTRELACDINAVKAARKLPLALSSPE